MIKESPDYLRARHYSPVLRRFLQREPILFEGGINLYSYTGCDFVNRGDWEGYLPNKQFRHYLIRFDTKPVKGERPNAHVYKGKSQKKELGRIAFDPETKRIEITKGKIPKDVLEFILDYFLRRFPVFNLPLVYPCYLDPSLPGCQNNCEVY